VEAIWGLGFRVVNASNHKESPSAQATQQPGGLTEPGNSPLRQTETP